MSLRALRPADLDSILDLQAEVLAPLAKGFIRPKPASELAAYLDGRRGAAFGVEEEGRLVAIAFLMLPGPASPNPADLPFRLVPAADWSFATAFLENTMVVESARGRGLQSALVDARLAHARAAGMRWICSGVHFRNRASWRNLLARGLVIADCREDRGYPALGLLGALGAAELRYDPDDAIDVPAAYFAAHRAALAADRVGTRQDPATTRFCRLLAPAPAAHAVRRRGPAP